MGHRAKLLSLSVGSNLSGCRVTSKQIKDTLCLYFALQNINKLMNACVTPMLLLSISQR